MGWKEVDTATRNLEKNTGFRFQEIDEATFPEMDTPIGIPDSGLTGLKGVGRGAVAAAETAIPGRMYQQNPEAYQKKIAAQIQNKVASPTAASINDARNKYVVDKTLSKDIVKEKMPDAISSVTGTPSGRPLKSPTPQGVPAGAGGEDTEPEGDRIGNIVGIPQGPLDTHYREGVIRELARQGHVFTDKDVSRLYQRPGMFPAMGNSSGGAIADNAAQMFSGGGTGTMPSMPGIPQAPVGKMPSGDDYVSKMRGVISSMAPMLKGMGIDSNLLNSVVEASAARRNDKMAIAERGAQSQDYETLSKIYGTQAALYGANLQNKIEGDKLDVDKFNAITQRGVALSQMHENIAKGEKTRKETDLLPPNWQTQAAHDLAKIFAAHPPKSAYESRQVAVKQFLDFITDSMAGESSEVMGAAFQQGLPKHIAFLEQQGLIPPNPSGKGAAATTKQKPTVDQFLAEARKKNPGVSDEELTSYYNSKYGGK